MILFLIHPHNISEFIIEAFSGQSPLTYNSYVQMYLRFIYGKSTRLPSQPIDIKMRSRGVPDVTMLANDASKVEEEDLIRYNRIPIRPAPTLKGFHSHIIFLPGYM